MWPDHWTPQVVHNHSQTADFVSLPHILAFLPDPTCTQTQNRNSMGNLASKTISGDGLALENEKRNDLSGAVIDVSKPLSKNGAVPDVSSLSDGETEADSFVSSLSDPSLARDSPLVRVPSSEGANLRCKPWDGKTLYSDFIQDGLNYLGKKADNVIMLYESPSSSSTETSFFNNQTFPVHDYPAFPPPYKTVLAPLRYSIMNGAAYPSYLADAPPKGLMEHWERRVPNFVRPKFVNDLADDATVYAYLPLEHIKHHLNDPHIHYHLAGKDAIHLMTKKTAKLLANTKDHRPCIAKVTHSMSSKGIFMIRSDDDEQELQNYLNESGNPNFVVTELVDIHRNVSCHFFIHPNGEIIWIGSSENYKDENGEWSMDSIMLLDQQDELRDLQLPYAREVADYCLSLNFWGFCGIDVLFDSEGKGYVVDVNPRTTGTSPALMLAQLFEKQYGYRYGLMRRSSKFAFPGNSEELLRQVEEFNESGQGRVVLLSFYECAPDKTWLNIAVHGTSLEECYKVLNRFAQPSA